MSEFITTTFTIPDEYAVSRDDFQCLACAALIKRYISPRTSFAAAVEPEGPQDEIGGLRGLFHGINPAFTALALAKAMGELNPDEAYVIERWLEKNTSVHDNLAHMDILVKHRCHSYSCMMTDTEVYHCVLAYMTEIYNLIMSHYEEEDERLREEFENLGREDVRPF